MKDEHQRASQTRRLCTNGTSHVMGEDEVKVSGLDGLNGSARLISVCDRLRKQAASHNASDFNTFDHRGFRLIGRSRCYQHDFMSSAG